MEIVAYVAVFLLGLFAGRNDRILTDKIESLKKLVEEDKPQPFVTNPEPSNRQYKDDKHIIEPKTPQQIQNDRYERIKRGDLE